MHCSCIFSVWSTCRTFESDQPIPYSCKNIQKLSASENKMKRQNFSTFTLQSPDFDLYDVFSRIPKIHGPVEVINRLSAPNDSFGLWWLIRVAEHATSCWKFFLVSFVVISKNSNNYEVLEAEFKLGYIQASLELLSTLNSHCGFLFHDDLMTSHYLSDLFLNKLPSSLHYCCEKLSSSWLIANEYFD